MSSWILEAGSIRLKALKVGTKYIIVLDGDWLVFQAMSAAQVETDWGDDVWTLECDHAKAWEILTENINAYLTRRKAWKGAAVVMAFTDIVNWRKTLVDPTYKENRKASRKPVGYRDFVTRVMAHSDWISVCEPELEGDDVMGIIGSNPAQFGAQHAVLVSCDKDFKTIPYCEFLWCTTGEILNHELGEADWWHMYQTVKGDITDGYGGIPGWGETAEGYLEDPYKLVRTESILKSGKNKGQTKIQWVRHELEDGEILWDGIVSLGAKAGMTEEEVKAQARMARILRDTDYDIESQTITLWEPPIK